MTWHPRQLAQQTGRTFVVTGANSGIGLAAASDLVGRGATVVLAVRDAAKGERARASMSGPGTAVVLELDLADLNSVDAFAKLLLDRYDGLSALVCNAGVMGGPLQLTAQGFERQMGTNHLGHAALVSRVWPLLHSTGGRVVLVSSLAARGGRLSASTTREELVAPVPYVPQRAYSNSKQANLLFAQELHRRAAQAGSPVSAVACHPGVSDTQLFVRQLRERGLGVLAPVAKGLSSWPCSRPLPGRCRRCGRWTTARRAAPSSARPRWASCAAGRSCWRSTGRARTRRRPPGSGS
jgi:protochlorophyllide reductase